MQKGSLCLDELNFLCLSSFDFSKGCVHVLRIWCHDFSRRADRERDGELYEYFLLKWSFFVHFGSTNLTFQYFGCFVFFFLAFSSLLNMFSNIVKFFAESEDFPLCARFCFMWTSAGITAIFIFTDLLKFLSTIIRHSINHETNVLKKKAPNFVPIFVCCHYYATYRNFEMPSTWVIKHPRTAVNATFWSVCVMTEWWADLRDSGETSERTECEVPHEANVKLQSAQSRNCDANRSHFSKESNSV